MKLSKIQQRLRNGRRKQDCYCKNQDGFKELNKLIRLSTTDSHSYYKNRISIEEFLNIFDEVYEKLEELRNV